MKAIKKIAPVALAVGGAYFGMPAIAGAAGGAAGTAGSILGTVGKALNVASSAASLVGGLKGTPKPRSVAQPTRPNPEQAVRGVEEQQRRRAAQQTGRTTLTGQQGLGSAPLGGSGASRTILGG